MYLQVKRQGDRTVIELPTVLDRYYTLGIDMGSEIIASLLARDIDARLDKAVRLAREEAYAKGWADAKAKRQKQDYFSTWLEIV